MPKISRVILKDGTVEYRARGVSAGKYPNGQRRQVTVRGGSKDEVLDEIARLSGHHGARLTGRAPDGRFVSRNRETLGETLDGYLEVACAGRAPNTRTSYIVALKPVRERYGHRETQTLTMRDGEALVRYLFTSGRRRGGTPGTDLGWDSVNQTLMRANSALEKARQDGLITVNPWADIRMPERPGTKRVIWSDDETRRFFAVADADRLAGAWRLAVRYDLDRGQMLGLMWDPDVLSDGRIIMVSRARVLEDGEAVVRLPRKPKSVPVDGVTARLLRDLRARQRREEIAAGPAYAGAGFVVADELGRPVPPAWFSDEMKRLCRIAGVRYLRLDGDRRTAVVAQGTPLPLLSPPAAVSCAAGTRSPSSP